MNLAGPQDKKSILKIMCLDNIHLLSGYYILAFVNTKYRGKFLKSIPSTPERD